MLKLIHSTWDFMSSMTCKNGRQYKEINDKLMVPILMNKEFYFGIKYSVFF